MAETVVAVAVSAASATSAVLCVVAVLPPVSAIATSTVRCAASSAYRCNPLTVNVPSPAVVTAPALWLPSPQSIVAVKSPATAAWLASENVATAPLNVCPFHG